MNIINNDDSDIFKSLDKLIPGSKYFTWSEALYLPQWDSYYIPNQVEISNIIETAVKIDHVRELLGEPMIIHSWIRPKKYNAMIGGAQFSQHMLGRAVDFTIRSRGPKQVQDLLLLHPEVWPYRIEIGTPTWTHIDTVAVLSPLKRGFKP